MSFKYIWKWLPVQQSILYGIIGSNAHRLGKFLNMITHVCCEGYNWINVNDYINDIPI
jgi:hypothetical protein